MVAALPGSVDALMKAVSEILRKPGDGMLDLFAGFYGTDSPWGRGGLPTPVMGSRSL